MTHLPRDNTEAEIDAFGDICERLGGFDERLSAEWVDGYLTALSAGPRAVPLAEWLPRMAGDAYERAFADPDDRMRAERALQARAAVLADQLDPEALLDDPDALRLSPLMLGWDDTSRAQAVADFGLAEDEAAALATGAVWAEGFFAARDDFVDDWPGIDDEDEQAFATDLFRQVLVLRLPPASDELRAHIQATYRDDGADRERLVDEACYAVQDLRLWWVDHAPRPATRHVEKAPGRNDPCPCGSGKKFKKCHGAA
jgi:uncharacterized protein